MKRHAADGAMAELETDRLTIREVIGSDADCFLRYMQEERYLRFVPIDPPTAGSIEAMVNRCIQDQDQKPRLDYFMAVVHKSSGEVIGEAILRVRNQRWRQGEIGWGVVQLTRVKALRPKLAAPCGGQLRGVRTVGRHAIYLPRADCRAAALRVGTQSSQPARWKRHCRDG